MPLYEGIGLISEKHAVVLDIGAAYTKCGYAGECQPRAIVATPAGCIDNADVDQLYDSLQKFIHYLYFQHLLVNPKDRRVVVVECVLGRTVLRETLARVLFGHFEVLSVLFAPAHVMPLFTLGAATAIVLDVGFKEATLIPVYENVPILKAWQALPLASQAIHAEIRQDLRKRGTFKTTDDTARSAAAEADALAHALTAETVEDIKVRLCFTTTIQRGKQLQQMRTDASSMPALSTFMKAAAPSVSYPLKGAANLQVDGLLRESVCEVLFEVDGERQSVATMVLDALLACPIDTRRALLANIVLVGGTTMMPGFKARLFEELEDLLRSPHYSRLGLSGLGQPRLHRPPAKANFACWLGAAIFGATDAVATRSLPREQYLKDKAVPDWPNLRFNALYAEERKG